MKIKNYLLILILSIPSFVIGQTGDLILGNIVSNGISRSYLLYVPLKYKSSTPVPLIYDIHGWTGTSAKQEVYYDFRKIADTANFIVVIPQALPGSGGLPSWKFVNNTTLADTDKTYLINLLDTLESQYTINPGKIYATGFSQGAVISYNFACNYSSRFAAVVSVSGGLDPSDLASCSPIHPMPIMEIHGTADSLAKYKGSSVSVDIDTLVKHWVEINHCHPVPTTVDTLPNIADTCHPVHFIYTGGNEGATVEFYKIINGGHAVPTDSVFLGATNKATFDSLANVDSYGAGYRCLDFSASQQAWRFLSKYTYNSSSNILSGIETITPKDNDVLVYPNPSNGTFTVKIENYQNTSIKIMNVLGETIFEETILSSSTIVNLGNVPNGIYIYQTRNQTSILKSGKLIVQ